MALSNQAFCRVNGEILNPTNREVVQATLDSDKASEILGFDISELGTTRTAMILENDKGEIEVTSHKIRPESTSLFQAPFNYAVTSNKTTLSALRDAGLTVGFYTSMSDLRRMDAKLGQPKQTRPSLAA